MTLFGFRKIVPDVRFDTVTAVAAWCDDLHDRTFYFKTQTEFNAAIFIIHNRFCIPNPLEVIQHECDHADTAKRWGVGHYFKLQCIITSDDRLGIKPGVVTLIGNEVDDRTYAFLTYMIVIAPERLSDDDVQLAHKMKEIMAKYQDNR